MTETVHERVERPTIVMVGTSLQTMGGISTVVSGYVSAGLFKRMPIIYVETHSDGSHLQKLKFAAKGYLRFSRTLATRKVQVVHIHLSSRASFWRKLPIFALAKLLRKPVLLHLHGSEFMIFYEKECGPIRKRIVRAVFNRADRVIVLSPNWATNVRRITKNPRIEVIFNGVPVPHEPLDRSGHDGPANILFLGRLGWRKGIYDLLDALAELQRRGSEFFLTAAGDGEIAEVESKAHELGLSQYIQVPGWIDEEGKSALLQRADIFVLPSHAEGLPMSLLEAMATGLPVVCTSVGGIPTAVTDGSEGFIVPPGNIPALAEALNRLLANGELRNRLGKSAFERAKNDFDVQRSVERLVRLYERYDQA